MKIAVVNNFFPPRVGGSAHLSHSLAVGYAKAGHEVIVITAAYPNTPPYEEKEGMKIFRFPALAMPKTRLSVSFDMAFAARPSLRKKVEQVLGTFQPDVIHQHGQFFDLTWSTGRWARENNVPVLLSVHTRLESPTPMYAKVFRQLDRFVVKPILKRYQPTFVVMDVQMDDYIKKRYKGAIGGTVDIPVGVEPDGVLDGDGSRVYRELELDESTPLIVSLGHVIQMRNRITLVEALPLIRQSHPEARLVVVGGVYFDQYLTRARELGVDDMVINTGAVPRTEIKDYLAAATVEAHDLQGFGLGTASLEAMAAGVPVIAAVRGDNFAGAPLVDDENCWLTEVGNAEHLAHAIREALDDREKARRVGAQGRALVDNHFTMRAVLDEHLTVLSKLASSKD